MYKSSRDGRTERAWAPYAWVLLTLAVVAAIARPVDSHQVLTGIGDAARHVVVYAAIAAAATGPAYLFAGGPRANLLVLTVLLCSAFGTVQELRQAVHGNQIEWEDITANVLGTIAGVALGAALGAVLLAGHRRARRRRTTRGRHARLRPFSRS